MEQPRISRRTMLETSTVALASASVTLGTPARPAAAADHVDAPPPDRMPVTLTINGSERRFDVDPRTSLLDLLREHAGLTGSKKGCDHGQCGACTVILESRRINACLSLAVMHDGERLTTIEGLAQGEALHPMQTAFVKHDGFQCGYCTPGQICSAVAMLDELKRGMPSAVTADLRATPALDAAEIRERMSGNICRCSAYPNIVAAIEEVAA
jgi:xanthine dehydrogenase YagT iron-sulfur-binding subunit